ncbi:hypothetical protein Zmor_023141 [Zophobas morio]|uniref:Ion transport domain-containing protein n=1 Tax=Zophobas morio TaxID=2755281 RepID=A0AA38HZ54_9CUCU|nr:hypothetical protein Zmor_023141 [Zophobas morio]
MFPHMNEPTVSPIYLITFPTTQTTRVLARAQAPLGLSPLKQDQEYICSKDEQSGMHRCKGLPNYINGTIECTLNISEKLDPQYINNDTACVNWNQYYEECQERGPNPFQGTISFDNIGLAWVSIFLVISLEGWTDIMYYVQDAHSFWDWIYFVLLIVIGSFFMINLCLVVIATQFSETKKREMERMRLERARFQSSSTLASSTNNSEPTSCYAEIVKYIAHLWRRGKRRLLKKIRLYRVRRDQRRERKMISGETIRLNYAKRHHPNCPSDISRFYKLQQDQEYICSKDEQSGMHRCKGLPNYINGTIECTLNISEKLDPQYINNDTACVNWNQYYEECQERGPNPFQGTISFDNIGLAWVSIFLVISLEGWTDIMYYVQDAHSFWDWIYFVLLIVIGSFFMINLCLVVIATQFSETKKREMERMRLERARFQSSSTLASSTNNSEPTSCYAEIVKYIAHLWRRGKRRLLKKIRLYRVRRDQRRERKMISGETIRLNYAKRHHPNCPRLRQHVSI